MRIPRNPGPSLHAVRSAGNLKFPEVSLSLKEESTMTVYVTTNDLIVSDDTVRTLERSLPYLGSGVSRRVHDLGNGQVLKLGKADGWAGGNQTEYDAYQRIDEDDRQHFATCYAIADDGTWLVAEKIEQTVSSLSGADRDAYHDWSADVERSLARKYGIRDLHSENVGMRANGTFAILDYAMGDGGNGSDWSEDQDDECACSACNWRDPRSECGFCDDCDCEACKPEGCDCPSLVGCNVTYCGVTGCDKLALAQRFTVRFGGGFTLRKRCNVHGTADRIELRGQGQFRECFATVGFDRKFRIIEGQLGRIPR